MRQREGHPVGELRTDGGRHVGIVVAEHDRAERQRIVDVLVAVDVPHVAAVGTLEEQRRHPADELRVALAERLRAGRDDFFGAREVLLGAREGAGRLHA